MNDAIVSSLKRLCEQCRDRTATRACRALAAGSTMHYACLRCEGSVSEKIGSTHVIVVNLRRIALSEEAA